MKISYSILTHNETDTLLELIEFLVQHKDEEDEIVILDDYSDNEETKKILDTTVSIYEIVYEQRRLLNDFASQKNYLKRMCSGDYIFNLDADELPSATLMENVKTIIEANPTIDLFWLPRINIVEGMEQQHVEAFKWNVNDKGWINWPDWQGRIHKNRSNIKWEKPVHEMMTGYAEHTTFPAEEQFAITHVKPIDRQIKQNQKYWKIITQ